jgi:predicted GNAT family acetyltransferase
MNSMIDVEINASKGAAFLIEGEERLAEMTFSLAGDKILIIDHTEVDERLRGQKVGRKLLDSVLKLAEEQERKIMPLCPFAKSVFDKEPQLKSFLL